MHTMLVLAGFAIVAIVLADVFESVVVPRPVNRFLRPSAYIVRNGWLLWRAFGHRLNDNERRESFLGTFAPLMLVVLLAAWVIAMIVGYGAIFFGLRDELKPSPNFLSALYFAGSSLLTIGYGDITPVMPAARVFSIMAGASGFAVVAIITAFLFSIFGSYQKRESFVVFFTNRAGAPASGVDLLEMLAKLGLIGNIDDLLRTAQTWMAELIETHLAYPTLTYFRSTHDDISWVGVLGAVLDAATLTITTVDIPKGEALLTHRLARHVVHDLSAYFGFPSGDSVGVERGEFDAAYDRLRTAGLMMRERESAWLAFSETRATYATQVGMMAQFWRIPPSQWIGDRSLIGHHPPIKIARKPRPAGAGSPAA